MSSKILAGASPCDGDAVWHWQSGRTEGGLGASEDPEIFHRLATKVRFSRGRTIFNHGDDAAYAYRIGSGIVRLCKHTVQGRRLVTHFLFPGDYFGFMQPVTYSFTAEAVTEVNAIAYPQRPIERAAEQDPAVRNRVRALLMRQLLGAQDHLLLLGCLNAEERVSSFLLWLARRMGKEEVAFDPPVSRQDMADYLGLTVETVCRTLSKLRRTGLGGRGEQGAGRPAPMAKAA